MPAIQEFEASLHSFSQARYGQWRTVDLHNHSPASHDFGGNKDTALDDAVTHLLAKPVDVVMFTDHHKLPDAAFVEQLSKRSGRTVLRGAELNVFVDAWSMPQSKIQKQAFFHLLVGFDPEGGCRLLVQAPKSALRARDTRRIGYEGSRRDRALTGHLRYVAGS